MKDLDSIYCDARELAPEARPAFLRQACAGDEALRVRLLQMLSVAEEAEAFLTDFPDEWDSGRLSSLSKPGQAEAPDELVGRKIDRYLILERIGEGGCGVVYAAEQAEPVRRRVALKVIKPGMDTKAIIARFEAERQALAMMDSSNIARIHDAGTTDAGRPFFAMELVRGPKITDYCDDNRLNTQERVELFIKVCNAIQHAHQKGVIHRDIKPSNILVTLLDGAPVPKVIDFGIAKATDGRLTDATLYTHFHQFIGTPAYMSPEQSGISGQDIDTRSDIYSLGVLLYELLVGCTPFDTKELVADGLDAMRQTIRDREPVRPSTKLSALKHDELTAMAGRRGSEPPKLIHTVKGDLDWIVMKCLEKDRTRRYDTVNGLAADLKRHLDNEPVIARPPSRLYEFQKTVRRHKFGFAATTGILFALAVGMFVSTWQAFEATRARRAEAGQRQVAESARAHAEAQQKNAEAEWRRAEEQLTRAEWLLYATKLRGAQSEFDAAQGGLALRHLEECPPALRGWEHRHLWSRFKSQLTLAGHRSEVSGAAFSPDGQRIVTSSGDRTAKIWDAASGREVLTLKGHANMVSCVAFSPDGTRLVTGSWDKTEKIWDATTGGELLALAGHTSSVSGVAFSPDGTRIVTVSDDGLGLVWDAATGRNILTLASEDKYLRRVAFSPDGHRIVAGQLGHKAWVWDARTGRELLVLKHRDVVQEVAFSPDGKHIVVGSSDNAVTFWNGETGDEVRTLNAHTGPVRSLAFSPNGHRLVTGGADRTVKVWDLKSGKMLFTLIGHDDYVSSVGFSPDGRRIITGSGDRTAKVWDAEKGQEIPTLNGHLNTVYRLAFSPDSKRIASASQDKAARIWDAGSGREILRMKGHAGKVYGVAFSPNGEHVATAGEDGTVRVWDAATGLEIAVFEQDGTASSVAYSPDGMRIVTGSHDGTTRIRDGGTGSERFVIHAHKTKITSVSFSPDGKSLATASWDMTARIWDASTGAELHSFSGHSGYVLSVAFSPDGERVVTASQDGTARVCDTRTGREVLVLKGHTSGLRDAVFSPDGRRIVTGGDDKSVKVWDAGTGMELLTLSPGREEVFSVAFSPDGHRVAAGVAGVDAIVKIWSSAPTHSETR